MKKGRILMLIGSICLALMLAIPVVAGCAKPPPAPEVIMWRTATSFPAASLAERIGAEWDKELETRSGGRIKIERHSGGELLGAKEMVDGIKTGIADLVIMVPLYTPGKTPLLNFAFLPFLGPSRIDQTALIWNELGNESSVLEKELDKWNAVYAGVQVMPPYDMMGNIAVRKCEDLNGAKVRTGAVLGKVLEKFGASTVMVPSTEMFTALDTGLVDLIVFNGDSSFYDYKIYEASKYYMIDMEMSSSMSMWLINKDSWNALPNDLKQIIVDLQVWLARKYQEEKMSPELIAKCRAAFESEGIETIHFPPEERAKLMAAAEPTVEAYLAEYEAAGAREFLPEYKAVFDEILAQYPHGIE